MQSADVFVRTEPRKLIVRAVSVAQFYRAGIAVHALYGESAGFRGGDELRFRRGRADIPIRVPVRRKPREEVPHASADEVKGEGATPRERG